ncbi:MAG: hypothetical protein JO267_15335 [Alphaproteobacteria bacterium]|nr:hypothetical protein [Alphaproteobacteria bacterium]
MSEHQFSVGQAVQLVPDARSGRSTHTRHTIVRLLPEQDRVPQYQIRSAADGSERRVMEVELRRG